MKAMVTLVAAVFLATASAQAHDYTLGPLRIVHPWARATPAGAQVGGGYMSITNNGGTADKLIGGTSSVAGRFEIHEMSMDNGVMRMRPLKDGLEIKPGQTVEFKPGSLHVMLLDLKNPLKAGDRVKGTLIFEKAGTIEVEYAVGPIGSTPAAAGADHGEHRH